jgi:hypothetical protein
MKYKKTVDRQTIFHLPLLSGSQERRIKEVRMDKLIKVIQLADIFQ